MDAEDTLHRQSQPGATAAAAPARRRTTVGRLALSTGNRFTQDMAELMTGLQATTAHFIHCIKPNDKEQPELLSYDMVAGQLIQLGTLDVVRLMGLGFPVRLKYGDILERYLPPLQALPGVRLLSPKLFTEMILEVCELPPGDYKMGVGRLFLRHHAAQHFDELVPIDEAAFAPHVKSKISDMWVSAERISRQLVHVWRSRQWNTFYRGVVRAQNVFRMQLATRRFRRTVDAARILQHAFRSHLVRRQYLARVKIQARARLWLGRRNSHGRAVLARQAYLRQREAAIHIQRRCRLMRKPGPDNVPTTREAAVDELKPLASRRRSDRRHSAVDDQAFVYHFAGVHTHEKIDPSEEEEAQWERWRKEREWVQRRQHIRGSIQGSTDDVIFAQQDWIADEVQSAYEADKSPPLSEASSPLVPSNSGQAERRRLSLPSEVAKQEKYCCNSTKLRRHGDVQDAMSSLENKLSLSTQFHGSSSMQQAARLQAAGSGMCTAPLFGRTASRCAKPPVTVTSAPTTPTADTRKMREELAMEGATSGWRSEPAWTGRGRSDSKPTQTGSGRNEPAQADGASPSPRRRSWSKLHFGMGRAVEKKEFSCDDAEGSEVGNIAPSALTAPRQAEVCADTIKSAPMTPTKAPTKAARRGSASSSPVAPRSAPSMFRSRSRSVTKLPSPMRAAAQFQRGFRRSSASAVAQATPECVSHACE